MITATQETELLRVLATLPPEKFSAARDFILYLQTQYGQQQPVDESDEWSDEDLRGFTAAATRNGQTLTELLAQCEVDTGLTDLARQHDHYLYGKPKVD